MMTRLRWARVEYQLDLRASQPPVGLGVIVAAEKASRVEVVLAGKAPRAGFTPEELKTVGPLGRSQLDGWIAAMAKDVMASLEKHEDTLDALVAIWCWNLRVVIDPEVPSPRATTRDVLAQLYSRHLGMPLPRIGLEQPEMPAGQYGHWTFAEATYISTA